MTARCATCGGMLTPDQNCPSCLMQLGISGRRPLRPSAWLPPIEDLSPLFPQLELQRLIGCGGMGAVYQARQTHLDRDVALKLIQQEISTDPNFLERFEREAKTLAKLAHPNIVTIFDYGQASNGIAYFVMEYVEGINLRQAIESKSLNANEAIGVMRDLCAAVEFAHSRGVVHRDIKPENILLSEEWVVKIADFGIAKIITDSAQYPNLTATRQVLGSPHYLAPEYLEAPDQVDHRVDIYALGIVFYELLTGQLPWGQFESPRKLGAEINEELDAIVMKALQRKPNQRFSTVAQMRDAIQDAVQRLGPQPVSQAIAGTASRRAIAVPFKWESESDLVHAIGMVYSRQDSIQFEFRYRDALFGAVKSTLHQVVIPTQQLTQLHLVHGSFSSRLEVVADSLSVLGELPGADSGCVKLRIQKRDRELAEQLVESLGFKVQVKASRENQPDDAKSRHVVLGVLLVFCGIFNAGALAIGEIYLTRNIATTGDSGDLVVFSALLGIVLGPIACLQILAGLIHSVIRVKSLVQAAAVISMLPFTPVWILSLPVAIWALQFLNAPEEAKPPVLSKPGWGATTLMFLRESRTARWVSIGNGLLICLALVGLCVYQFGWYPVTIQFRMVGSTATAPATFDEATEKLLTSRLRVISIYPDRYQSDRFHVRTYANQRKSLLAKLAIEQPVRIVVLPLRADSGQPESTRSDVKLEQESQWRWLPTNLLSTGDKDRFSRAYFRQTPLGEEVAVLADSIDLNESYFVSLSRSSKSDNSMPAEAGPFGLNLTLSQAGRTAINELPWSDGNRAALGLEVEGQLVGFHESNRDDEPSNQVSGVKKASGTSSRELNFRCVVPQGGFSLDSIEAAIRGPMLPFELELIP